MTWDCPHEWLRWKVNSYADAKDVSGLVGLLLCILNDLNHDFIQDIFEREMDSDGYFIPPREDEFWQKVDYEYERWKDK